MHCCLYDYVKEYLCVFCVFFLCVRVSVVYTVVCFLCCFCFCFCFSLREGGVQMSRADGARPPDLTTLAFVSFA